MYIVSNHLFCNFFPSYLRTVNPSENTKYSRTSEASKAASIDRYYENTYPAMIREQCVFSGFSKSHKNLIGAFYRSSVEVG